MQGAELPFPQFQTFFGSWTDSNHLWALSGSWAAPHTSWGQHIFIQCLLPWPLAGGE